LVLCDKETNNLTRFSINVAVKNVIKRILSNRLLYDAPSLSDQSCNLNFNCLLKNKSNYVHNVSVII